jgi:hypothetical protein
MSIPSEVRKDAARIRGIRIVAERFTAVKAAPPAM